MLPCPVLSLGGLFLWCYLVAPMICNFAFVFSCLLILSYLQLIKCLHINQEKKIDLFSFLSVFNLVAIVLIFIWCCWFPAAQVFSSHFCVVVLQHTSCCAIIPPPSWQLYFLRSSLMDGLFLRNTLNPNQHPRKQRWTRSHNNHGVLHQVPGVHSRWRAASPLSSLGAHSGSRGHQFSI